MRSILASLCALLVATAGCAEVFGVDDVPYVGDDTANLPEGWECIGSTEAPEPGSGEIFIPAQVVNIATGEPVSEVSIFVCSSRISTVCDTSTTYTPDAETGIVNVPVTAPFNGYLRIEDADGTENPDDFVTYLWYFSQTLQTTREEPFPIFAMTRQFRTETIYIDYDGSQNNDYGEIAVNVTDCSDSNAAGVRFSTSDGNDDTVPFYFSNNFPIVPAGPEQELTDAAGLGGFLAMPPGVVDFNATYVGNPLLDDSQHFFVGEDTLLVQENALTTVRLIAE